VLIVDLPWDMSVERWPESAVEQGLPSAGMMELYIAVWSAQSPRLRMNDFHRHHLASQ
jgi:hypothetical protein